MHGEAEGKAERYEQERQERQERDVAITEATESDSRANTEDIGALGGAVSRWRAGARMIASPGVVSG